jgi:hypothetical protein
MLQPNHHEIGMDLARLSGRDPAKLGTAAAQQWAARGLALQALARGDMAGAEKIMAHAGGRKEGCRVGS